MKVNVFFSTISCIISLLIAYLAYNIAEGKDNDVFCSIGTFICLMITLMPTIGLQYKTGKIGTNIRVLSAMFFIVLLISNLCFAWLGVHIPSYIITNGIILIIFLAIFYKMINIKSI